LSKVGSRFGFHQSCFIKNETLDKFKEEEKKKKDDDEEEEEDDDDDDDDDRVSDKT
jgi:hypothetical protein